MNPDPTPGGPSGIDPLLGSRDVANSVDGFERNSTGTGSGARTGTRRAPRRRHAASGARALALSASVVTTGVVAVALAYSEGAWSGAAEATDGSTDQPTEPLAAADTTDDSTSDTASDTASDTTPDTASDITADADRSATTSTSAASTTTPQTNETTDLAVETAGYADGVYTGTAEYTEWGDVQVQVTISDGAIIDVAALQYPTGRKSSAINDRAVPMLEADAIAQQGADLDIVSGATYTSRTYADSLQAALDQAAVTAAQEAPS